MKKKLCLLAINAYTSKSGDEMASCIFIGEDAKMLKGFIPYDQLTPEIEQCVTNNDVYEPERARVYSVHLDSFNDKLVYKVDVLSIE